ncbi:exosome complex exonuclease RRP44-like [Anneissia japonica]|uniref:exosome complex exonuclease RRP44-like n=1 Tax=Anneissia japonica TaxID=1529436 RepID=UPI00142592EB|nr:exosome complex exonuclease RRP44-like [Anneissia japonica]
MLKSKSFVKKTRKGGVIKVVREHYLRDDIWCGSKLCCSCGQDDPCLEARPSIDSDLVKYPHYLLLDTNVLLHQVDILEDDLIKNVIILQTVQKEVKHRSLPAHKRIRDIIANKEKKFYVFTNEHHKDTFIEREGGESANDYNDRAIRNATSWFNGHLDRCKRHPDHQNDHVKVVLLTNDQANREKAIGDGLQAYTIHEYVKSLTAKPELVDRLALIAENEQKMDKANADIMVQGKVMFPEYVVGNQLHLGIKLGKYLQGTFHASRENYKEGSVNIQDQEKAVFIKGLANLNRSVHGDVVAVEMLPEDEWTCPSSLVMVDNSKKDEFDDDDFKNESDPEKNPVRKELREPTGRVVGIIKRNWRPYCGILQPSLLKEGTRHLFIAAEKRIPKVRIETRQFESLRGCRIVVSIDSWPRNSRYPLGHFVKKLGEIGDRETENEVLLLEHDIPHEVFSSNVLSFLPKLPWTITQEDYESREDLRHLDICSVDPPGCTDIDDALHCRKLDNGLLEVGVHIADVSHFIKPGNALDDEAANRGTTVYLVDKRIDMVPDLLSSNLCSLREKEERFAFSCIWEMTEDAEVVSTRFCKSVICSRSAYTYEQAQLKIDDKSQSDALTLSLRNLNKLAKILKRGRMSNGALTLASAEIRFNIDSETHDPIDVQAKQMRDTNSMVEEFMLLANISVAKRILQSFSECALLRRHPIPPPSNFDTIIKAAKSMGFTIVIDSGKALSDSLDAAVKPDRPYFNTLLRMMTTRCMTQALYFSSGTVPESDYHHFGLAAPIYTHFTSPIRRYSDLMVHRMLAVCIKADRSYPDLLQKDKIQAICNNLNYRHRMAQYAGRSSVGLHTQIFFKNKREDEEGYVMFVRKNALQIFIPKYGLEGTLFLKPEDKSAASLFTFNEEDQTQSAGDICLHMFDPVTVQLSINDTDVQHQRLMLRLVKPQIADFSVPPATAADDSSEPPTKKMKASPS